MTKLEQMLEVDLAFADPPGPYEDFSVQETITRLCRVVSRLEKMVPHALLCRTKHDCDLDDCRHKNKTCNCDRSKRIDSVLDE